MSAGELGVVVLAQGMVGRALLQSAAHVLGKKPGAAAAVSVSHGDKPSDIEEKLRREIVRLKNRGGVVILCDLFGATPANAARRFAARAADGEKIACVFGVNLPMLLETLIVRDRPLAEAAKRAAIAGKRGIREGKK